MNFNKKIGKYKKREVSAISSSDELDEYLTVMSGDNKRFSMVEIKELIFNAKRLEYSGKIKDLEIKFLQEAIKITWNDKTLGHPIKLKIRDKNDLKELIEFYNRVKRGINGKTLPNM